MTTSLIPPQKPSFGSSRSDRKSSSGMRQSDSTTNSCMENMGYGGGTISASWGEVQHSISLEIMAEKTEDKMVTAQFEKRRVHVPGAACDPLQFVQVLLSSREHIAGGVGQLGINPQGVTLQISCKLQTNTLQDQYCQEGCTLRSQEPHARLLWLPACGCTSKGKLPVSEHGSSRQFFLVATAA